MRKILPLKDLARLISERAAPHPMRTRIIAIDGCGGAGKSTLAARLAAHLQDCPIIHTDDFASPENPLNWWPRMLEQVFTPLTSNEPARYQRYDWREKRLADWITVAPQEFLIVEGVSSFRAEFRKYIAFSLFIDTPRDLRLARGLARDGAEARDQWLSWMAQEDAYVRRDKPDQSANLRLSGVGDHADAVEIVGE